MVPGTKRNPLQSMAMLLITQIFLLLLRFKTTKSGSLSLPGCPDRCGDVLIPYPFGIGSNCSISPSFNVACRTTRDYNDNEGAPEFFDKKRIGIPTPYFSIVEIVNISIPLGQIKFNVPIASQCDKSFTKKQDRTLSGIGFTGKTYWLNSEKNKLIVTGCNTFGYLTINTNSVGYSAGCLATCDNIDSLNKYGKSCTGIGCCQSAIVPKLTPTFSAGFDLKYNQSLVRNFNPCSYAMVVDNSVDFVFNTTSVTTDELIDQLMPVVFDWVIENTTCNNAQANTSSYACKSINSDCLASSTGQGYICNCSKGYEGNPYVEGGCQDIDDCTPDINPCSKPAKCHNLPGTYRCSCPPFWRAMHDDTKCQLNLAFVIGGCAGIVALSFVGFATFVVLLERRKYSKAKDKYFQQHGGWILLEKIKSSQGSFGFTIFTKQQLELATDNFDSANIIGHGGQGTVYKGNLRDQTVAIKKCKIVDESKKKEFGKEMVILSQINHKNIVKLIGCCLEVEIPMLVYEFIPNGTLFQYIHCEKKKTYFSLKTRLRIAQESAEALAYLHTSASPPIFHGDVKSLNILLDQNHTAKVSDFGASVLAPTDESQFVTLVQGTCGYLDPEYMQSSRLTDKSDVYSFGVVLLELLTRKPVFDFDAPEDERGLSSRFLYAMEDKKLQELVDDEILCEDNIELITKVSELAKECINMKGVDRPTMKEVAEELERISKLHQHPWIEESHHIDAETNSFFQV